ncbi:MAG TPA: wax ester/triacylglycerol synthase family O-acyltransferase [Acidimicrobiales bacterium]|jgi:WS/DGAT/MGAT family acyltransferase|nr:wax ester/triacylglycerol synthase family O-acyltransferase [Acidimicrobiales bacterium]
MERLSGLDAAFLALETPSSHMHVASLAIFDPSTADGPLTLERIVEVYGQRLHLAPPFRRRLATVPLGLHHPLWIEDPDFDIRNHLRHTAIPAPGGPDELATLVGRLVALPLDRSRPLWEIWLIEGLEGGKVALLSKVHHAAIDGAAGNELQVALLDLSPTIEEHVPETEWVPDRVPTDAELLTYAASSLARQPVRVAKAVARTAQAALDVRRMGQQSTAAMLPPAPFAAPRTSFNAALTPRRSFAYTTLDLRRVKAVKTAAGCTVNDAVLALGGGALRRYLEDRGEELDGPLVAMVPVSVRTADQKGAMGNQVSSTLTSLGTDIEDAFERLKVIHEVTSEAKAQQQAIGADTLQQWSEFAAPALLGRAARLYTRMNWANAHRPLFNVTISNVPGPPFPLYSAGARMLASYPVGPIFDGGGLNMTVMSYLDQLDFGLLACPDLVDDVWDIADDLHAELDALVEATGVGDADLEQHSRA